MLALVLVLAMGAAASSAFADPTPLAALAPQPKTNDDVRRAVAIGPSGEVYVPDGAGAWTRKQRITTGDTISRAGRAGADVVAWGEGVVYKLAPNGWSAIRLHQKDKAVMSSGPRAVAAVKRQLYALDRTKAGEPEKLALAPAPVLQIGAGTSIVIATDRGLARVDGAKVTPIAGAPKQVARLIDDRWAILAGSKAAHDLRTNKTIALPGPLGAAAGLDDTLFAAGTAGGKLELWTIAKGKLEREPIVAADGGNPVGLAVDRAKRVVVALADGRLLLRDRGTWTSVTVSVALPADRPGSPPALAK